jgi:hypothetical protein
MDLSCKPPTSCIRRNCAGDGAATLSKLLHITDALAAMLKQCKELVELDDLAPRVRRPQEVG